MEAYIWLILASMFCVGIVFGFVIGRGKEVHPTTKVRELEEKLEQASQDMDDYRGEVSEHFGKTAELFNQLTNDYRTVYEHLAESSEKLCGDQVEKLKALTSDSNEKPLIESEEISGEAKQVAEETPVEEKVEAASAIEEPADIEVTKEAASDKPVEEPPATVVEEAKLEDKASEARTIH
ncbi:ZapG family protein [Pseudomonadota bacterium]